VVEIGAGNGQTTREILIQMPESGFLLAIEKTKAFIDSLNDRRLIVQHGDAANLVDHINRVQLAAVDVVVPGVLFSALPPVKARQIVKSVHDVLSVGVKFMAYQLRDHVSRYADPMFGKQA